MFDVSACSFIVRVRKLFELLSNDGFLCVPAIRFGRMPQAEKLKLKAESNMVEKEVKSPMLADHKILIRQIHEAYMKNFNMNKAKARLILTGKNSNPVKERMKPRKKSLMIFFILHLCSVLCINHQCVFPSSLSSFMTWRRSSWQRRHLRPIC